MCDEEYKKDIHVSIFGSCRQYQIKNYFQTTSIQDDLTFPHYTKEIIQALEYSKGEFNYDNDLTRYCFRTGILNKMPINNQKFLQEQFERTDLFVVEIASRTCYEWNNLYLHHILAEENYGFNDIRSIKIRDLSDEEIENDLLRIKDLVFPKKLLVVSHLHTRKTGKRYELINLLRRLTEKYEIPFMDPSELLQNPEDIYLEKEALNFNEKGSYLVGHKYKAVIDAIFSKKTVVFACKPSYFNMQPFCEHFFGIGDIIRGISGMYKLSKKYNFNLIIDMSLHPISKCIKSDKHYFSNKLQENSEMVEFLNTGDANYFILNHFVNTPKNYIFIFSNMESDVYNSENSQELKKFVKYALRPKPEFIEYFNQKVSDMKLNNYKIIHYRLGDDELVKSITNKINYDNVYTHLNKIYSDEYIVLTDSQKLKDLIRLKNSGIKTLDCKICHLGLEDSFELICDTLVELFLITNSKGIKSYTSYSWISGFAQGLSCIYDIPLEGYTMCNFDPTIIFFNCYHLGDIYFSQQILRKVIDANKQFKFKYAIKYYHYLFKDFSDLECINFDYYQKLLDNDGSIPYLKLFYETYAINLWIGSMRDTYRIQCQPYEIYKMFRENIININTTFGLNIFLPESSASELVPITPSVDISIFLNWKDNNKKEIIFYFNYLPKSGQNIAVNNHNNVLIHLCKEYSNKIILIPSINEELEQLVISNNIKNIFSLDRLFGYTENILGDTLCKKTKILSYCDYIISFDIGTCMCFIEKEISESKTKVIHSCVDKFFYEKIYSNIEHLEVNNKYFCLEAKGDTEFLSKINEFIV